MLPSVMLPATYGPLVLLAEAALPAARLGPPAAAAGVVDAGGEDEPAARVSAASRVTCCHERVCELINVLIAYLGLSSGRRAGFDGPETGRASVGEHPDGGVGRQAVAVQRAAGQDD